VLLCGVRSELVQKFVRTGSMERLHGRVFLEQPVRQTSTQLAVRHAYQHLASPCAHCPRRDAATRTQSFYYAV
jgi:hypothetical protein